MAFARVNGIVIHHELRGPADGPTVVFSNSLGTDFRIWDPVVARLPKDWRLLRYDKRGHGLSQATAHSRMSDHVADAASLIDHLGIPRATVVGLSVGGMIAQGLAALRPELVNGLVLSNTAHKIGNDEMWNGRIASLRQGGIAGIADPILERWFSPGFRTPDNPDFIGASNMLRRSDLEGYIATCEAIRDADLTESTRALKLPVTCIAGEFDGSTPPALVRSLADLIEGAEFHLIDGAGHIPCVEKPDVVAGLVEGMVRRTTGS
jgi:3-oxoadipate enol-lactonase